MSKPQASFSVIEEIKSSIVLTLIVALVAGYLLYGEQQKRKIPADFDSIETNIAKTKMKIKDLIEGEDLPSLERSLKEVQVLAEGFGVRVELESHEKHRNKNLKRRIGNLEYSKSQRWSGRINGNTKDVLVFIKMSQQLVPIEFKDLNVAKSNTQAEFTIVGS